MQRSRKHLVCVFHTLSCGISVFFFHSTVRFFLHFLCFFPHFSGIFSCFLCFFHYTVIFCTFSVVFFHFSGIFSHFLCFFFSRSAGVFPHRAVQRTRHLHSPRQPVLHRRSLRQPLGVLPPSSIRSARLLHLRLVPRTVAAVGGPPRPEFPGLNPPDFP